MKKFALRGLLVLAIVVALCIFFSGTVRTLTTPKARFAPAKMGKMEQEIPLKGKVVFPEEEEWKLPIPEEFSLTVTRVAVAPGDKLKAGDLVLTARVTDGEKSLETLRKETEETGNQLREAEKKTAEIRLSPGEKRWQEAWEREEEARGAEREARVNLLAALRQAGLEMTEEGGLPAEADGETQELHAAWTEARVRLREASEKLKAVERYAIPEDTWKVLRQKKEYEKKLAEAEEKLYALQVLMKTAGKITAPRSCYVSSVGVEKGSVADADTVILKMTGEGQDPVIRVDLSEVRQEVKPGAALILESEGWSNPQTKIVNTGLGLDGHPWADAEINSDVIYSLGSVGVLMKAEIKAKMMIRSQEATCLLPASAVRGSGDSRYVYTAEKESSAFGGSGMKVRKTNVTVLAENGTTASVAEDLTYDKVLYMEDRALQEGGAVMEYPAE